MNFGKAPAIGDPLARRTPWATLVLIVVCCAGAIYIPLSYPNCNPQCMLHIGANWGPLTLSSQAWRLFTSQFLYGSVSDYLYAAFFLGTFGSYLESKLSGSKLILISEACGMSGAIEGLAIHPSEISYGLSPMVFGLAGASIACWLFNQTPRFRRGHLIYALLALGFASWMCFWRHFDKSIDHGAHVSGLLTGIVMGSALFFPCQNRRLKPKVLGIALLLTLGISVLVIRSVNGYIIPWAKANDELNAGHLEEAQRWTRQAVLGRPNNILVIDLEARTALAQRDFLDAERTLGDSLRKDPSDNYALYLKTIVLMKTGRCAAGEDLRKRLIAAKSPYEIPLASLNCEESQ